MLNADDVRRRRLGLSSAVGSYAESADDRAAAATTSATGVAIDSSFVRRGSRRRYGHRCWYVAAVVQRPAQQ